MVRYRRKKALYEVISKTRPAERLHPELPGKDDSATGKSTVSKPDWVSQWRRKPRIVQFYAGRIELSMPYQLAIALLLGVVLLILLAFRAGEYSGRAGQELAPRDPGTMYSGERTTPSPTKIKPDTSGTPTQPGMPAEPKGDHRIVIQQFHRNRDLEHVQRYFLANGINTVIEKRGAQYFLLTKDAYENPKRAGTDGAAALRRIKQIGA